MRALPRGRFYFRPQDAGRAMLEHLWRGGAAGALTAEFESAFAAYSGARHAIATPHARVAFLLLLRALALPRDSELLMTPLSMADIANAVLQNELKLGFVDLGPRTGNIDPDALEARIRPDTRALLVTHMCGFPSQMDRVAEIAERRGLVLLEDVSQVQGARFAGRMLGRFGRAGVVSLVSSKTLSTFHGGMVLTDDDDLAARIRAELARLPTPTRRLLLGYTLRDAIIQTATSQTVFDLFTFPLLERLERVNPARATELQRGRFWGKQRTRPWVARREIPSRFMLRYSDWQAAIGLPALARLDQANRVLRDRGELLLRLLREHGVEGLPEIPAEAESVYWRFPLWVDEPRPFRDYLRERGIDTAGTNMVCVSREPAFAEFHEPTPQAEAYCDRMVFLPMHPTITRADIYYTAACVSAYPRSSHNA